jgi:hypothetical protein
MTKMRRAVQGAFLALTLSAVFGLRANAESWCPFGGVEALYTYIEEGNLVCSLGLSNFYALAALLVSVVLVRRAFCGYVCPIGTISEWLRWLGRRLRLPAARIRADADAVLSLAKYAVLAAIVYFTWRTGELMFRGCCPAYALLGRNGADITAWAYVAAGAVAAASLVVSMPFCRWFCPLGAVVNPLSRFGLTRVRRRKASCLACGRCARACPMAIPVDCMAEVTHARCLSCMTCIDACDATKSQALGWGPPRRLGRAWPRWAAVGVVLACAGVAAAAAHWAPWPSFVKSRGTPPQQVAYVELQVRELTCRGRANLLVGFLERDDLFEIPGPSAKAAGYYRLEAWPSPGIAKVRVYYDPASADADTIRRAITEPYFHAATDRWWMPPFAIEGYSPLGLDDGTAQPGG